MLACRFLAWIDRRRRQKDRNASSGTSLVGRTDDRNASSGTAPVGRTDDPPPSSVADIFGRGGSVDDCLRSSNQAPTARDSSFQPVPMPLVPPTGSSGRYNQGGGAVTASNANTDLPAEYQIAAAEARRARLNDPLLNPDVLYTADTTGDQTIWVPKGASNERNPGCMFVPDRNPGLEPAPDVRKGWGWRGTHPYWHGEHRC